MSKEEKKEWRWKEGDYTVVRSCQWTGPGCHNGCGVLYYIKDGKIEKVEGDPDSPHYNGRLCMRCLALPEVVNHKDRLKWPLKRVGNRGEDQWERISWDEAYDIIEEKVHHIQKEYGPESIVGMEGTGRNIIWQVPYLTYAGFGSPNFCLGFLSGDACYLPRAAQQAAMCGDFFVADLSQQFEDRYDNPAWKRPEVFLIWGNNPIVSNPDGFMGHWIVDCMKKGSKLIVVDPQCTWLAAKATYWLQLRPGTDCALGMALLNVIINEGLQDQDFIDKWTHGYDELKERIQEFPPEKVAKITWVPEELIVKAARFYATNKPAAVQWGLAVDQSVNGIESAQTLNALWAITGNHDVPGGNIIIHAACDVNTTYTLGYYDKWLTDEMRAKRMGDAESPLKKYGIASTAHSDRILTAIESDKPYPIKMLWLQTTNPIANMAADAPRVYRAMKKTDFNVVVDLFMTPTAIAAADLVLPAAMSPERDSYRAWFLPLRAISKLTQYEECKSDEQICLDLGKRLNPEAFPWETVEEWLTYLFQEIGTADFTFADLQKMVHKYSPFEYKKYEKGLLRPDGKPGFNTPTGKVELSMTVMDMIGLDPLPHYEEPSESPYSSPELFKEYPLLLTTGARSWEFFHSEHRQISSMREFHPDPLVQIHPETAAQYGISENEWIWIENMRGKCKQKVTFSSTLNPKVVRAEHGWWLPEKKGAEPDLFGVFDYNINNLVPQCENGVTGYGAPVKCQICKIYKVTAENDKVSPTETVTTMGGSGYAHCQ